MKISLVGLTLENFKGVRSFSLHPGNKCLINGANASGKTTLMDSFLWLLFGKDSQGKADFAIKTLKDGQEIPFIEHSVQSELDIDGRILALKKVLKEKYTKKRGSAQSDFTGHTTDYYIDGVPVQKKDWDEQISQIIDEETFKLLTSPTYFNSLHWEKRRTLLLEVCGDISDSDVIASDKALANLPELLGNQSIENQKKIIAGKRKEINQRLTEIPSRIDELDKSLADVSVYDIAAIQVSIRGLDRKILAMVDDTQLSNLRKAKAEVEAEISELEGEKGKAEREATKDIDIQIGGLEGKLRTKRAYIADSLNEITRTQVSIESNENETVRLRAEHVEIATQKADVENTCPTCGQPLPKDQIDAAIKKHNQLKAALLADINLVGRRLTNENARLKESIENIIKKDLDCKKEAESLEKEINKLRDKPIDMPFDTGPIDKLKVQIAAIEKEIAANPPKDTEPLENQRQALQVKVAEVDAAKKTKTRIIELGAEEKTLAAEYEDLERQISLLERFITSKVGMLEEKINSRFSMVNWKLFEVQINQGISECCVALVDGIPWDKGLNHGSKINAGIDIIKTLSKHYGISAPLWVDMSESITDLLPIECQMIKLRVDKNYKQLHVENEEN